MSIGIAVMLPDGAFLASDSRQRNVIGAPNYQDIPDKLIPINSRIYAVGLGAIHATREAASQLKNAAWSDMPPRAVSFAVQAATARGWQSLTDSMDLPWHELPVAAILLVGGLAQNDPVVAGSYYTSRLGERPVPRFLITETWGSVIFGGDKHGGHYARFEQGISALPAWEGNAGPINKSINGLQKLTFDIISEAAATTADIGGPVTCVVIRRDFSVYRDVIGVVQ